MANLDGTTFYGQYSLEDQILQNLITFIKFGLLEIGAFYNIEKDTTSYDGQNASLLRPTRIPGQTDRTVYEGLKHDWIWETGISLKYTGGNTPTSISGIYFNDTFYPTGTLVGGRSYHINYSRGAVVFSSGCAVSDTVKVAHSLRAVNVYSTDSLHYKNLLGFYQDRTNWNMIGSGIDNISNPYKAYLPAIFVSVSNYKSQGMEIGSRSKYATATINFDIFTTNHSDRKKLSDICFMMEEKTFPTYNVNEAPQPLNSSGMIYPSSMIWPQLTNNYPMRYARFDGSAILYKNYTYLPIQYAQIKIGLELPVFI